MIFELRKMKTELSEVVRYRLGDIEMNELLGREIKIHATGVIRCVNCAKQVKKTFSDGYCFVCFQKLACCDICVLKPELCHYHNGTCREPEWAKENCLIKHVVYLSNTTGIKVGITRAHKMFERWADQGALEAVIVAEVPERLISGRLEVLLAKEVGDRTDWRSLILGKKTEVDLLEERRRVINMISGEFTAYIYGESAVKLHRLNYPVIKYPEKVKPHNFDKEKLLEGPLNGIRGQYLFVGEKAVNIRKYSGYEVEVHIN